MAKARQSEAEQGRALDRLIVFRALFRNDQEVGMARRQRGKSLAKADMVSAAVVSD